jgi:L-amino acid N-acyltransferase
LLHSQNELPEPSASSDLKPRIGDLKVRHTQAILGLVRDAVGMQGSTLEELKLFKRCISRALTLQGPSPIILASVHRKPVGFAVCSTFEKRPEFSFSAECTIFVVENYRGRGIGTALAKRIILRARELHYHTLLVGSVASPDDFSDYFFRKLGFEFAGMMKEVGLKSGKWEDIRWYQMLLERRSPKSSRLPVFGNNADRAGFDPDKVSLPTLVIDDISVG